MAKKKRDAPEVAKLENKVERLAREVVQVRAEAFSGPLPPPEILAGYERTVRGAAERILVMAELQAAHRQAMETRHHQQAGRREVVGMALAFVLAMTAVGGGIYLAANGQEVGGIAAILTPLASLVAVFLYVRHDKKNELGRKWREMLGAPRSNS